MKPDPRQFGLARKIIARVRALLQFVLWTYALLFSVWAWPIESTRIQHRLVDAETGRPITNALGVYWIRSYQGNFAGSGGPQTNRVLIEAFADSEGKIEFLPRRIEPCAPWLCLGHWDPVVQIFAPGYLPKELHDVDAYTRGLRDALKWPQNGSVVKLERPASRQKYFEALDNFRYRLAEFWNDRRVQCDWNKIPQTLASVHLESWYRNKSPDPADTDDEVPNLRQTLVSLRHNELYAGEPYRSRISSCPKVLDVLNKTPIRCKDGSVMKGSRWDYVPAKFGIGSGGMNVSGTCPDQPTPITLVDENIQARVRKDPQRLGLLFDGCGDFNELAVPPISKFKVATPPLQLSPLDAFKILRVSTKLRCGRYDLLADNDFYYFIMEDINSVKIDGRYDKKKLRENAYAVNGFTGKFVDILSGSAQQNF